MRPIFLAVGLFVSFIGLFFVENEVLGTPIRIPKVIPDRAVVYTPPEPIIPQTTPEVTQIQEVSYDVVERITPLPLFVMHDVPFVSQAPFGNWADAEQNYGCEEASLLMAFHWANGKPLTPEIALREIKAMSKFELQKYGEFHDTSVIDTLDLMKSYLNYHNAYAKFDIGIEDIKTELAAGNLVIIPFDATKVTNIYYTPPGPFRHQMVVVGYDDISQELIAHDPGTIRGANYRYSYEEISDALMDYPTGLNIPVLPEDIRTAMIVVSRF